VPLPEYWRAAAGSARKGKSSRRVGAASGALLPCSPETPSWSRTI